MFLDRIPVVVVDSCFPVPLGMEGEMREGGKKRDESCGLAKSLPQIHHQEGRGRDVAEPVKVVTQGQRETGVNL